MNILNKTIVVYIYHFVFVFFFLIYFLIGRDSTKRLSTKSPAKGVVKPMVSGHTITKPTINLSRVNMQHLQNVNLSMIEEGPSTPERTSTVIKHFFTLYLFFFTIFNVLSKCKLQNNRHSRPLPEILPVPVINDAGIRGEWISKFTFNVLVVIMVLIFFFKFYCLENEEHSIVNRRTSRFSANRLSSGRRYSKRNSGRISSRLSKRSAEYSELIKSPRVTLQDVSRYLSNSQTVNVRLVSSIKYFLNKFMIKVCLYIAHTIHKINYNLLNQ